MPVTILNESGRRIPKSALTRAARAALNLEGAGRRDVSLLLTDDDTTIRLNRRCPSLAKPPAALPSPHRAPASPPTTPRSAQPRRATVISVETAERQAAQHRHPLPDEHNPLVTRRTLHLPRHEH